MSAYIERVEVFRGACDPCEVVIDFSCDDPHDLSLTSWCKVHDQLHHKKVDEKGIAGH